MADLAYCTAADVAALAGQLAVDLRTDDADQADLAAAAIDFASGEIDWYCSRFAGAVLAASRWVRNTTAVLALRWLCLRRLNAIPEALDREWDEDLRPKLEMVQAGKAGVPGAASTRRPVAVTNYHVDLRRTNRQVRVDRDRSTGVAKDYSRPTDPSAETGDR